MQLYLSRDQFVARHGDDLVFLDAVAGQYRLIAGAGQLVDLDGGDASSLACEAGIADVLISGGIATPFAIHAPAAPPLPSRSVLEGPNVPIRLSDRLDMGRAWRHMLVHYYGRPFNHLIQTAKSLPEAAGGAPNDEEDLTRRALAFDQQSPWIPFQGDCLFRAFMLLRLLQWSGRRPLWVFGVRTWPFYAHCWLQDGSLVLTDFAENLANFTPIMAV